MTTGQGGVKAYMNNVNTHTDTQTHTLTQTHNNYTSVKPLMYCHAVMALQAREGQ